MMLGLFSFEVDLKKDSKNMMTYIPVDELFGKGWMRSIFYLKNPLMRLLSMVDWLIANVADIHQLK